MKTMEVRNTAKVAVIILGLVAALGITSLCITENAWADQKENETHQIAIAADRYGNESAIAEAMKGMPKDVEYVSLVGDMAGSDSDRRSEYNSSDILDEVKGVGFTGLGSAEQASDEVSILWADNDENVQDDAGTRGDDAVERPARAPEGPAASQATGMALVREELRALGLPATMSFLVRACATC